MKTDHQTKASVFVNVNGGCIWDLMLLARAGATQIGPKSWQFDDGSIVELLLASNDNRYLVDEIHPAFASTR